MRPSSPRGSVCPAVPSVRVISSRATSTLARVTPSAFRHRDFTLFWVSLITEGFALQMAFVAIGWQVYSVRGKPLDRMSRKELIEFKKQFSYCFQNNALFDSMTVFDNIALPLRQTTKMKKREIERSVMEKMEQLEIADATQKYPSELSGGMQKRVALARALITDPKIVLFDEPTTGLDPVTSAVMDRLMVRTREHLGVTGVVVTHDMRSAYTVGDRIAMLYEGTIRQVGTVAEIQHTEDPVVRQFIEGRPE